MVTVFGIAMEVSPEHRENAPSPIVCVESGMQIWVSSVHPLNALFGIISTFSPNVVDSNLQPSKIEKPERMLQFMALKVTVDRFEQFSKAP
jgi:hypothetical protein